MIPAVWILPSLLVLLAIGVFVGVSLSRHGRARDRLFEGRDETANAEAARVTREEPGFLSRWLFLAGFRAPGAVARYVIVQTAAIAIGFGVALYFTRSGTVERSAAWLLGVPGGLGDVMRPILFAGPWILFVIVASAPFLRVRAARRRRVAMIEQDFPVTLDLLATLAEAGLGFDASLARILDAQPEGRPLAHEFRMLQFEIRAGVPRIRAFRHLSGRIDVLSVTAFVSALVHAEQVGAGMANVLRRQAEDVRVRRRENALMQAQALPVKLIFPLVICFLPGLFVTTLGPALHQVVQLINRFVR